MNQNDFKRLMDELCDYYGEKHFPPKMRAVVWRIVANLEPTEFAAVIEAVVEEGPRIPSPAAIKKAAGPYLRRAFDRERTKKTTALQTSAAPCTRCAGYGRILALLRTDVMTEYTFACPYCIAARTLGFKNIPFWNDDLRGEFVPVSASTESWLAAHQEQLKARPPSKVRPRRERAPDVIDMEALNEVLNAAGE